LEKLALNYEKVTVGIREVKMTYCTVKRRKWENRFIM